MSYEIGLDRIIYIVNLFENEYGHYQSVRLGKPVDALLNPIPWYTYPAIEYLKQFDFRDKFIFEYGSGNSSLFWASLAKNVTSVEINPEWFQIINESKPNNCKIVLKEDPSEYANFIHTQNQIYDLIVIDGSYRHKCAVEAIKCLSDNGLIILDNSERYPKICSLLRTHNLIQVDFSGIGPINYYTWTTSIFYQRKINLKPSSDKLPQFSIGSLCEEFNDYEKF
jgi:hypothetical protein